MKRKSLYYIVLTALFAALVMVFTAYIAHIPMPGTGGFVHFGDALVFLAACLLPRPYAALAGALGAGLADLLSPIPAPAYVIPTVIVKACVALCFSAKREKILCARNALALLPAGIITLGGYFLAEGLIYSWQAALLQSLTGNLVQWAGSAAGFAALGFAMDRAGLKKKI
ncbi:MAG: TIGR04002 family protein [Oscillospiraceae bacterium]|jgi:uncharacterized repeat protein (TIGR04002 family)|nr:TIGR04002 family protein [Oscillospiraceae bacterium]